MPARLCPCLVAILVAVPSVPAAQSSQEPTIEAVLASAGEYVMRYQRDFAGIVAEETYAQDSRLGGRFDKHGQLRSRGSKHRELKSDLLLVRPEGADGWIQFRDVFEVDGREVRDRTDRLAKLFLQPSASTARQVGKIMEESARYNVGTIVRNVNVPVLALRVLLPQNQHRFLFNHVEVSDNSRAAGTWAIDYREVAPGTMIRTGGGQDLPAHGRFWIEPDTGRVLVSTLKAGNRNVSSEIDVIYGHEPALGVLVPREMRESYEQADDGAAVTAVATYSNFRQFQVKVDEKIAPIK
jgi:hypothetical protein